MHGIYMWCVGNKCIFFLGCKFLYGRKLSYNELTPACSQRTHESGQYKYVTLCKRSPTRECQPSSTVSDMYMYINSYCNNTGTIIGFAHDHMLSYMPDIVYMTGRFAVCMRGRDGRSVLRHGGVDGPF